MNDPMRALFSTVTEAFQRGHRAGMENALGRAINRLDSISLRHEKASDAAAFHVAEECIAELVRFREMLRAEIERDEAGLAS